MKKYWKRMFAGILIVIFALSSAVAAFAATPETTEDYDEVIAIIHTNDVHGHIEVEPYVKGLADQMKASGEYSLVLTVSAGDVYSGGHAVAGYYNGELIPAIEDQVYDVIVPGNNDFPTRIEGNVLLSALYTHTKTICANIQVAADMDMAAYAAAYSPKIGKEDFAAMYDGVSLSSADGSLDCSELGLGTIAAGTSPWPETLIIETSKGTKLGLFGLTCTYIGQTQGTVNAAKECVASLKAEGANAIVGIGHTGWMGEGSTAPSQVNDTNSWVVASEVQDMDALIDSHTHSIINDGYGCYVGDNKVLVNQASCFGKCIGIMYIYLKEGKVVDKKAELLRDEAVSAIAPDPAVQATVDAAFERLYKIAGEPVATTPYYLNGGTDITNEGGHVRGNETNMGDFITDILRAAASEKAGVDFAFSFFPGYCVRSSVEESAEITNIEIASIFGMPGGLEPKVYTAKEIVDLVTTALLNVNPSFGKEFMQFSGIEVFYTTALGADGKSTTGIPAKIKVGDTLIYDVLQGGIQVDDDWTVLGLRTLHPNDMAFACEEDERIAKNVDEIKALFHDYLATHEAGKDYTFYPNTIAPAGRIVEIADYAAVIAAQKKADALDPALYTEETWQAVEEALSAVVDDLDGSHQAEVDAMAEAIEEAIASLKVATIPYYGDKVFFVQSSLADADEFGMWRIQEGTTVKLDGDNVLIHIVPKNTTTYGWMHWGGTNEELTKDVALNEDGTIDLVVSTDYCGYAHPIAPIKKSDGGTTSAQYFLAIPAKNKLLVNEMDEIQQAIDELQKQLDALKEQLTVKPGWNQDGDNWVFYDDSYHQVKGWLKDGGKWYFLDKVTGIMKTGWVDDEGTWYYMNASGAMQTGWQKIGNTWYYLKNSGAMAANEWCGGYWLNANGSWTYQPIGSWKKNSVGWWFGDTSGWYAKNTTQKIDGVDYTFDANGYWK